MLQPGTILDGQYRIIRTLGHGGMSVVYLGEQIRSGKRWAIKEMLRPQNGEDRGRLQVLKAEGEVLKHLSHPGIPEIADILEQEQAVYLVMEYVSGENLAQKAAREGPLDYREVIRWGMEVCHVLTYLHEQDPPVIYRDLKPSNIMLQKDGTVKLIDFGAAREFKEEQSQDTVCLGTRGYAAPEQYGCQGQTDARTDIYGLGQTLYDLLEAGTASRKHKHNASSRDRQCSFPEELKEILEICVQRDKQQRFASCRELEEALKHCENSIRRNRTEERKAGILFQLGCLLWLLLGAGSACTYCAGSALLQERYLQLIRQQQYTKALQLAPEKEEAYYNLLVEALNDKDGFSEEEQLYFTSLLSHFPCGKGKTVRQAYALLSWQLGMAFYYRAEETNAYTLQQANRCFSRLQEEDILQIPPGRFQASPMATGWLADNALSETDRESAAILVKMTALQYRILYGRSDADDSGEDENSYLALWKSMQELQAVLCTAASAEDKAGEADSSEEISRETRKMMYDRLLEMIGNYAGSLVQAGISAEVLREEVNTIQENADYAETDPELIYVRETLETCE